MKAYVRLNHMPMFECHIDKFGLKKCYLINIIKNLLTPAREITILKIKTTAKNQKRRQDFFRPTQWTTNDYCPFEGSETSGIFFNFH